MEAQKQLGHEVLEGGGGGDFLGTALFKWKADVLHFHWIHPYLLRETVFASITRSVRFLVEIIFLKAAGTRIAWTIHNLSNHEGLHPKIEKFFSSIFIQLADTIFVHGQQAARLSSSHFRVNINRFHVISHPAYCGIYPNDSSKMQARQKISPHLLGEVGTAFLFLGRVNRYKGVFDLVYEFKSLPQNCKLIIAGEPSDSSTQAEMEAAIAADSRFVYFPQAIPESDLHFYFNAADIVVLPFRKILTSGSVLLAMSFGKPLVVPDFEVIRENVAEEDVWWFSPGNADSLRSALNQAAQTWSPEMGQANLQIAKNMTWQNLAKETLSDYQKN
jgi:glycosyltransferase involved in cell wall biosynthesis